VTFESNIGIKAMAIFGSALTSDVVASRFLGGVMGAAMTLIDRLMGLVRGDVAHPANLRPDGACRIVGLSMVKNEQDIIEPFIRHNRRFLDAMVLVDNASVDDTRDIAVKCARELGGIIVTDSDSFAYTQGDQMTRLLHHCQAAFFADFVVFLDADEFISAQDRHALVAKLQDIPAGGVGLMPWQTFILDRAQGDSAAHALDPPRTIRRRRTDEKPLFRKAVLRLDGLCQPDLVVWQGLHNVVTNAGDSLPSTDLDDLPLWHFPVRSHEQIIAKAIVGWMAYLARNPNARQLNEGTHWRDIFDRVVGRPAPQGDSELYDMAMRYAQDPVTIDWSTDSVAAEPPSDYRRCYSTGAFADPLILIARSWEKSLSPAATTLDLRRREASAAEMPPGTSAFDADWHWNHLFVDVAPFRFIAEKYIPASVLDIGCGVGAYLQLFQHLGAGRILGIDGIPAGATALADDAYQVHDLALPLALDNKFDLVVCVEVAEHLEARHADVLLDNITRHAGQVIVFSAAEPGQPGHGHINCAPIEHWLERLAARGWYPELVDSLGMRSLATMSWFRRNLVVLRRGDPQEGAAAIAALSEIGRRKFTWYNQPPGIRMFPFTEALPALPAGYATT